MRRCTQLLFLMWIIFYTIPHTHAASIDCTARSIHVNLHGCNLSGADLGGLNLSGTNLSDTILTGANLVGTDLQNAILTGATSGGIIGLPHALPITPASIKRVLFIGNSYTAVNNLPTIFGSIIKNSGNPVPVITAVTPGGQTFKGHLTYAATQAAINAGNWDVVVLQDQSQEPAFAEIDAQSRTNMVQSAAELCRRIRLKSPNARIFFYETWARHPYYWANNQPHSEGANPTEMQARLRKWYGAVAQANHATVAVVGDAWEYHYSSLNPTRLHASDNSHPVYAGSYLAGLIFYGKIYGVTLPTITWNGSLSASVAQQMQTTAAYTLAATTATGLPHGWHLQNGYLLGPGANLTGADLGNLDLAGIDLSGATLGNVTWHNTICPDGSNSDSHAASCQLAFATQTFTPTPSKTATITNTATSTKTSSITKTARPTKSNTATKMPKTTTTNTATKTPTP
ncbi:MAG: pentapeptide repeat-containing protein [Chloroflexales bacterium]|nr:pentapeptide repeat-containing protein [Chloroflexales bacterium]